MGPGMGVVGKNTVWPEKTIVLNGNAAPHGDSIFHRHVVAQPCALFDETVLANVTVGAHARAPHNMRKRPDTSVFTDIVGVHQRHRMGEEGMLAHRGAFGFIIGRPSGSALLAAWPGWYDPPIQALRQPGRQIHPR